MVESGGVDVEMNGEDENSVDDEENEGVDCDGLAVGLHAAELHVAVVSRNLEKKAWLEQDEEHDSDQDGTPVRHCCVFKEDDKGIDLTALT
ncbi:hypothetical protein SASPL_128206 [Salvia splendens]|uniref:Uncharacterized protein n=1 Tax=Salvia splendens TaxID=180675 RepID=A0A8X8ZMI5_SALSN|nr:hypothetical protein SASPL_128206 [Salvia splendens]